MFRRLRFIVPLLTVLVLSGCGGSDEQGESAQRASASSDSNSLLRSTFANLGKMQSATVDLKVRVEPRGANAALGPVAARLQGPFASQGANQLPKFAFNVELTSGGRTVTGGATYTGSKGYVTLQGTPYEVADLVLKQFVAGYEQSLKSRQNAQGGLVLGALGVDFRSGSRTRATRARRRSATPRRSRSPAPPTSSRWSPTWARSQSAPRACPARAAGCRRR